MVSTLPFLIVWGGESVKLGFLEKNTPTLINL